MTWEEYIPESLEEAAGLEASADQFEQGFTLDELSTNRIPGHPLVLGQVPAEIITLRILPSQRRQLDELAAKRNQSRSEVIRSALDHELAMSA